MTVARSGGGGVVNSELETLREDAASLTFTYHGSDDSRELYPFVGNNDRITIVQANTWNPREPSKSRKI